MFKFGFSEENRMENYCPPGVAKNDDITWFDCKELKLEVLKESLSFQEVANSVRGFENECSYLCGSHRILQVPYSVAVGVAVRMGSENIKKAEIEHSDLVPGKYEGGMKVWECTRDIADYIVNASDLNLRDKTVLDAGCGAGMLGILALLHGAKVVFQDYNHEVLELLTGPNILLNVPNADTSHIKLYSGDWADFIKHYLEEHKGMLFDVILTSETIYNPANYGKLHDVIASLLAPNGVCILGAKSIYFGVGGSIHGFMEFVNERGRLVAETCWSTSQGVAREILKITHNSSK